MISKISLSSMIRLASTVWLGLWIPASVIAWALASSEFHLERSFLEPQGWHLLGFDAFGRDLIFQLLSGSAVSIFFSAGVAWVSLALAMILGSLITMAGSRSRVFWNSVLGLSLSFPTLILALGAAAILGPGWITLTLALFLGTLPSAMRLMSARAEELLREEFILAAVAAGAPPARLVTRHILPHLQSLARVKFPNLFAGAILSEATLSFLGLGTPLGQNSWGTLLAQAKDYLIEAPHIAWSTGIPLVITILALQLFSGRRYTESA